MGKRGGSAVRLDMECLWKSGRVNELLVPGLMISTLPYDSTVVYKFSKSYKIIKEFQDNVTERVNGSVNGKGKG